ncbi:hypothetical protein [Salinimonas chungwhensis]|uniref:hypothetical protein n=1 Tax=Salinimonas chungwhensis TaxID=265425 RepID=UPI00036E349B|nr:hypothetical protein [Salinimonas chungwhensis]
MEYTIKPCFLCDAESKQSDTDHDNRSLVTCSNEACGQYEITHSAAISIVSSTFIKGALRKLVNKRHGDYGHFDISRPDKQIKWEWIAKQ